MLCALTGVGDGGEGKQLFARGSVKWIVCLGFLPSRRSAGQLQGHTLINTRAARSW